MLDITRNSLEAYLTNAFGPDAEFVAAGSLGQPTDADIKRFGYGKPLLVTFRQGGRMRQAVVSMMKADDYGHQFPWDRAAALWFQYDAAGRMERHARPLGLGYVDGAGAMTPLADPREFFIVMEKLEGREYAKELTRIQADGAQPADMELACSLAGWLARVHARKHPDPATGEHLYTRRIRELIGSSECIMGLIDEAYPHDYSDYPPERFAILERKLVDWRWKLKAHSRRLAAVHGDFHPWNVLVQDDGNFGVLDRSRGEWGEPAGDVACMAINYLLFGLLAAGGEIPAVAEDFRRLYAAFLDEYLSRTNDAAIMDVMAPFLVFRLLVIASPQWYPGHPPRVRRALLNFMDRVLDEERFDHAHPERYLRG